MTNKEWTELIAKEFNVSNTKAKDMLSIMLKKYESITRDEKIAERAARIQRVPLGPEVKSLTMEQFKEYVGLNIIMDYNFDGEIQHYNMRNFYINKNGEIKHKIYDFIMPRFVKNCFNPHRPE